MSEQLFEVLEVQQQELLGLFGGHWALAVDFVD